ncbi:MAG: DEAD/DEAH box helicase [Bacteroidota bacterium]
MFSFITRLFGTSQGRAIRQLKKQINTINQYYQELQKLSNDELRQATDSIRQDLQKGVCKQENRILALKKRASDAGDIQEKLKLFDQVEAEEKALKDQREKLLTQYLPQAFAIVKETARRFQTSEALIVTANDQDKKLADIYQHIQIKEGQAHYSSTWEVAGRQKKWNMLHYDVQLMGGIVLHKGKIAEMGTGEGKTLVATLPAFLNALLQKGVHIVTVNDYLAKRDAEWMAPIYQFHGITVDCIEKYPSHSQERARAYQADIVYGTNNEFGFDYLRDNMAKTSEAQVQRGHYYAIVDEIDSVLIDDARTPLIISGPVKKDNNREFRSLKPRIQQLYHVQKKLIANLLDDSKNKLVDNKKSEAGLSLFRVYRGLPKDPNLISYLSEKGIKQLLATTEDYYLQENKRLMPEADEPLYFTIDATTNSIELTDKGIAYLTEHDKDPTFFILPDIATKVAEIEKDANLSLEVKTAQRNQLTKDYGVKAARIHAINQLLKAYALFQKNIDYVVLQGKVKIVDEKTGRILEGRRYSDGLHQAIEAKEGLEVEKSSQTYATITPQNQFRMYYKLSGMTGTAATEAAEMWDIYRLEVVIIPPNKPIQRKDLNDKIYKTQHEKFEAISQHVETIKKTKRPILLITPSVEVSEYLRKKLQVSPKQVLNAKNHHLEADIIARAGQANSITIATQMAGRGTDIQLSPEALEAGGLYLIIAEKHETRRVNNQSRGRAGRQGDQGTTVCYLSLEDPLIVHFKHGYIGKQVDNMFHEEGEVLEDNLITRAIENVQKNLEQNHFMSRKRALDYDDVLGKQRSIIYQKRNHALYQQKLPFDILHIIYSTVETILTRTVYNTQKLAIELFDTFGIRHTSLPQVVHVSPRIVKEFFHKVLEEKKKKEDKWLNIISEKVKVLDKGIDYLLINLLCKEKNYKILINLEAFKRSKGKSMLQSIQQKILLTIIDEYWKEHLQTMEYLKENARNASYENKDPLLVYKFDGIAAFRGLIQAINYQVTHDLFHTQLIEDNILVLKAKVDVEDHDLLEEYRPDDDSQYHNNSLDKAELPARSEKVIGRNERVSVKYTDGTIKENVKYKTVEKDIQDKKCAVLEHDSQ